MKRKKKIFLIGLLFLLILSIAFTYGYYLDAHTLVNKGNAGESDITITENFPPPPENPPAGYVAEKEVSIVNNKAESYVRMLVKVNNAELEEKIILNFNTSGKWVKETDGYWYYTVPVKPGEKTEPFLKSVTFKETIPSGQLEIICYGESVQAKGYHNAVDAFHAVN